MSETLRFDPIYPAHAIERCSATLAFGEPLTDKLMQKVKAKANPLFAHLQMFAQVQPQYGIEINPQTGAVTPKQMGLGSFIYSNAEQTLNCIITPGAIIWNNVRYVRWQPFIGQIEQVLPPVLDIIIDAVDIASIKLEYLDRFYWSGDWSNFDSQKLLRNDRGMWAETAKRAKREWHSHSGWFDYVSHSVRSLININVDVVSAARPGENGAVPSVGILTLLQDQMVRGENGARFGQEGVFKDPISQLDKQHHVLKGVLAEVIVPQMAERIALDPKAR
ncbi:TIGR04255 family protein [Methylobacterium sp. 190mf]|uniref:TIGR04255 family protein n=1 Tax=Methylobacterium sp. 190mf TaxID=1761798 RepID=UPI00089F68FE|nr:TIGR04255 family protein [Methylobacterium sp. 190mf]SEF72195.1 TIGR04255 family protein [Methylobacterium sp. 190mf]